MNRQESHDDEYDFDEPDDDLDEGPQSVDLDELGEDDETSTIRCPRCREAVYEDSVRCPNCGHYIAAGASSERRAWLWAAVAAALILALLVLLLR